MIPVVVGTLGMVPDDLVIRRIETTEQLKSARILTRVLEAWINVQSRSLRWKYRLYRWEKKLTKSKKKRLKKTPNSKPDFIIITLTLMKAASNIGLKEVKRFAYCSSVISKTDCIHNTRKRLTWNERSEGVTRLKRLQHVINFSRTKSVRTMISSSFGICPFTRNER